jgi:SAM-dependent methyltransferase
MSQTCRICSASGGHERHRLRERMFGWGDEFDYFKCRQCGCLQIARVPVDLARFYPPHYYSFHLEPVAQGGLKAQLAGVRDRAVARGRGWIGQQLAKRFPAGLEMTCLGRVPLRPDARVLDVGCGRGRLLSALYRAGFRRLLGVDPFLAADVEVLPGLRVLRRPLQAVVGQFDCIMLHHVFEHIENGLEMLTACRERLAVGGTLVLRLPVVDCAAWERYGEFWVGLDAPRHLFLHTRVSLRRLADSAGLRVTQLWCDSGAFQFTASELYRKDIRLFDTQGRVTPNDQHFTAEQLRQFEQDSCDLNLADRGDQVVVLLQRNDQ